MQAVLSQSLKGGHGVRRSVPSLERGNLGCESDSSFVKIVKDTECSAL